jgi:hypothetical protein
VGDAPESTPSDYRNAPAPAIVVRPLKPGSVIVSDRSLVRPADRRVKLAAGALLLALVGIGIHVCVFADYSQRLFGGWTATAPVIASTPMEEGRSLVVVKLADGGVPFAGEVEGEPAVGRELRCVWLGGEIVEFGRVAREDGAHLAIALGLALLALPIRRRGVPWR